MNRASQCVPVVAMLLGLLGSLAAGCADTAVDIKACFAPDVPRRDQAARVLVYLLEACESVVPPELPAEPIGTTFSEKGGDRGPPIEVPPLGEYALYAIAQGFDDTVIAAGCARVSAASDGWDTAPSVRMEAWPGPGCGDEGPCVIDTGGCTGSDPGTGGSSGAGGSSGTGGSAGGGGCVDLDGDGSCVDDDCDDSVPTCNSDCETSSDEDQQIDCFERFCGTDPMDSASVCLRVSTEAGFTDAIEAANARAGHDYIVLDSFTMTSDVPAFEDDDGVSIRQVAGASLTVDSETHRVVFELKSKNNLIEGVRVEGVSNAETVVSIKDDSNIVRNCEIEGFGRRGVYVDGGDDVQILNNTITGGTNSPGKETAAIILRDTARSVVAGNTVALNEMDGLQVRKAIAPVIDHNSSADNGGSGIAFYEEPSDDVCLRNNNVTGNETFGLEATDEITFDTTEACTGPLSPGPAYGNNEFGNGAACGGASCGSCDCLPAGSFWGYSVDPDYRSVTVGERGLYCPGAASTLIDAGDALSYDLNGTAADDFNGSGPDIGSREAGPGDCD